MGWYKSLKFPFLGGVIFLLLLKYIFPPATHVITQEPFFDHADELIVADYVSLSERHIESVSKAVKEAAFTAFNLAPPDYLTDTDLRGGFNVDSEGNLIVTEAFKHRLDYFYMMVGDRSLDAIEAIIVDHIHSALFSPAREQALHIHQQYRDYMQGYAALMESYHEADPLWLADEIKLLRRSYLGDDIGDIFFADEESRRDQYLRRQHHTELNLSQKKTLQLVELQHSSETLRQKGMSVDEMGSVWRQQLGEAAADRLVVLERSRQQWQVQRQAYDNLRRQWQSTGVIDEEALAIQAKQELGIHDNDLGRLRVLYESTM